MNGRDDSVANVSLIVAIDKVQLVEQVGKEKERKLEREMAGSNWVGACGAGRLDTARARMKCGRCGGKAAKLTVLPPV